jgi:Class II flagellar assembly regulator
LVNAAFNPRLNKSETASGQIGGVMKIENGRPASSTYASRQSSGAAAPGFAPAADAPQKAVAPGAVGAVASLDAILALQSDDPPTRRRARQLKRGGEALDALETLERGLVVGHAPAGLRGQLQGIRAAAELTGDPGLDHVLQEIDIRVAVELAKLDVMLGRTGNVAQA